MSLPRCMILAACVLAMGVPGWSASQQADKPRIIFDSDMSSDHDDVGDIAVLHGLASMGECEILGMAVSSQNGATAMCMDAINTYYGKPNIPIGVRPDVGGFGEYAGIIASQFPHGPETQPKDFPLAVTVYRQLLAAAPDHSVTIATTGYLNNLKALMESVPDQYSALNGMDLIRLKVKLWACAGGAFPRGDEFNFRVEPAAAFYVVNNWPVAVTYVGFDIGQAIYTGGRANELPTTNPVRKVYVELENNGYPYPSWGQIAIYQAVRGSRGLWGAVTTGHNTATAEGSNAWATDQDPNGAQEQQYLTEIVRTPVRAGLDAMFHLPPNNGTPSKPGEPSDLRATVAGAGRIDLTWTDNAFNETGFVIERRGTNGAYVPLGTVGANVTSYSDTSAPATANASYRVKATNAIGDSIYSTVWVYSGWTEMNLVNPTDLPIYTYFQTSSLRIRDGTFRPDHVTLNNDSTHGQNLSVDVDVSALGHEGNFYIYFFHQDVNNWYRLTVGESTCTFEKRINGTITSIGAAASCPNLGNGSPFSHWRVVVADTGTLTYLRDGATLLNVTEALALNSGRIGLGGWARTPVWENFRFDTGGAPAGGAPVITQHPASQTVASGATATFTVAATGATGYQWQRNNTDIAGATSTTYTTPPVGAGDDGATYRAVVSNASGSVTSTAGTLAVMGAGLDPLISKAAVIHDGGGSWGGSGNTADKAYDGDTATFYDPANGDGAWTGIDVGAGNVATVTSIRYWARAGWTSRMIGGLFEGSNSPTSGYVTLGTVSTASDTSWTTLTVAGAAPYRYLRFRTPPGVWLNVAEIEFHGTLGTGGTVTVAPGITGHPSSQSVTEGQTATFTVNATGTATLTYQWQKNGATIAGATGASYTTPATASGDNGAQYRVIVTNGAGSATSNAATLTVTPASTSGSAGGSTSGGGAAPSGGEETSGGDGGGGGHKCGGTVSTSELPFVGLTALAVLALLSLDRRV